MKMTKTMITNGVLIDGTGNNPIQDAVVVIENEKIIYAGSKTNYTERGDEKVLDVKGKTILPGMIDSHVHMTMEYAPLEERMSTPFSYMFYKAAEYLKATLHAGVTSVRDALGTDYGVKKAVEDGLIIGTGKSNPKWNYSAPHGAGRVLSRKKAKAQLNLEEAQLGMEKAGVYTTSLNEGSLDEAKSAYKDKEMIINAIQDTVEITHFVKPIYNFKASD